MPVHVVNGRRDGPSQLFVSAALHGDEINGVEIIRRVVEVERTEATSRVRSSPCRSSTSRAFSISAGICRTAGTLNRSFPRADQRLPYRPPRQAVPRRSRHGFHPRHRLAHRRCTPGQLSANPREPRRCRSRTHGTRPLAFPSCSTRDFSRGDLRAAAHERGVPVIVYEAGEALRFDEAAIRAGVKGGDAGDAGTRHVAAAKEH